MTSFDLVVLIAFIAGGLLTLAAVLRGRIRHRKRQMVDWGIPWPDPTLHPNCRCVTQPIIQTEGQETMPGIAVKCTAYPCFERIAFEANQDRIPIGDLEGWTYDTDNGWRCPQHNPAAERSSAPQREETTMPSYEGESPAMKVGFPVRDSIDEATLTRLFRMSQMPQTELEDELDSGSIAGVRHLLNEVVDTRAEYRHRIDELNKLENNIRNHVAESAQAASTKDLGGIAGPGSDAYAKAARG